jgi:hypothetical protein
MEQMERLQVQLPRASAGRLRQLARQRGISVAALVREAVDRALSEPTQPATLEERWQRSLSVAARYGSGTVAPVSTEHDRYLDEIYGS